MEITERYTNKLERNNLVAAYEKKGWRMLHDNFDSKWKMGEEQYGFLTFTDIMPLVTLDYQAEFNRAITPADKIDVLARMLGLKV